MAWLSITLELEPAQAETLSEALLEAGADSVALDPAGLLTRLTALAPGNMDAGILVGAAARVAALAPPEFESVRIEDDDWVRRSQAQFGPIRAGARLWIVPSWHAAPDPPALALRLDPGLAFGTGSHPSTRLMLRFLERSIRGGERVLDYGCGSGILAIAAAKLGAGDVASVDLDPQALEASALNARANDVVVRVAAPESLPAGEYDVVVANILAGTLIALAPLLAQRTRPGGRVALCGILDAQADEVIAAYAPDFSLEASSTEEGWSLLEGKRK